MISFRGGGWVIVLAGVVFAIAALWQIDQVRDARHAREPGDGTRAETYGFDLSTCLVDRGLLVGSGLPRDGIPVLDDPAVMPASGVIRERRGGHGGKYLVPGDRVIGVTIDGLARAYPLRILCWHEVANDTLAGVPIAVTYSPLCDAAAVFDRRAGDDVLRFGHSGLVFNANLVMYDRDGADTNGVGEGNDRDPGTSDRSSLWSQLQARAIAGPAAAVGRGLGILPFRLVYWADWLSEHPATTVLEPDPAMSRQYEREPYVSYFGNDLLRDFPVSPLPPDDGLARKTPVLAVLIGEDHWVAPLPVIARNADATGVWRIRLGQQLVRFVYRNDPNTADPPTAWVESLEDVGPRGTPHPILAIPAFRFAWYAMYPEDRMLDGSE